MLGIRNIYKPYVMLQTIMTSIIIIMEVTFF